MCAQRSTPVNWVAGGIVVAMLAAALASAPARAAIPDQDILADSVLELKEVATFGSYQTLTVTVTTRGGRSTLVAVKDGVETRLPTSSREVVDLWRTLLALNADQLTDISESRIPPDTSRFTVTLQTPGARYSFTARNVDDLEDQRYRAVVREILHWTDSRAYGAAWRK